MDLKSIGSFPRRFEPCRQRIFFCNGACFCFESALMHECCIEIGHLTPLEFPTTLQSLFHSSILIRTMLAMRQGLGRTPGQKYYLE